MPPLLAAEPLRAQAGGERAASLRHGAAEVRAAVTPRGLHGTRLQAPLPLAGRALVQAKINFHGRRDTLCICHTGPLGGWSGRKGDSSAGDFSNQTQRLASQMALLCSWFSLLL